MEALSRGDALGGERLQLLDGELARLARSAGALRLSIGVGLEAMAAGGFRELGYPSLAAYALERCERSSRWTEQSRTLARRTKRLRLVSEALISGRVSWSQAEVIAAVATPEDEAQWVRDAGTMTVRQLRTRAKPASIQADPDDAADSEAPCTLTITVNAEDAWLFECATMMVRHLDGHGSGPADILDAAIMEGASSLTARVPAGHAEPDELLEEEGLAKQKRYEAQREAWRLEAEQICERNIPMEPVQTPEPLEPPMNVDGSAKALDARIRVAAAKLSTLSLRIGELADIFFLADGWRLLGYATSRQYAKERLGMSLSSLKEKRRLARGVRRFPLVGESLRARKIGVEAARLVISVATPATQSAWVARAAERTIVYLREEVRAAELLRRLGITQRAEPPGDEALAAVRELEFQVITGEGTPQKVGSRSVPCLPRALVQRGVDEESMPTTMAARSCETAKSVITIAGGQTSAALTPCTSDHGAQRSLHAEPALIKLEQALLRPAKPARPLRSKARTTLRLRVPEEMRRRYRRLERLYVRFGPRAMSFLAYCCAELMASWAHARPNVAYASVYRRDGFRCQNPVCGICHVTPHHVVFRGRGGSDDDSNVISACLGCHLGGIHEGHIEVTGEAGALRWVLGGDHMVIEGRRRVLPSVQ